MKWRYKQENDQKIRTALLVLVHKKGGAKGEDIANSVKFSMSTVTRIVRRFKKHGNNGLHRKHGGGNPCHLTDDQKHKVVEFLEDKNQTLKETNAGIQKSFGKSYHHLFTIQKFLKSLGFSRITPRKQHF